MGQRDKSVDYNTLQRKVRLTAITEGLLTRLNKSISRKIAVR